MCVECFLLNQAYLTNVFKCLHLRITIRYISMYRWQLSGDSVDIFMQTFQQVSEKLLGVLLTVAHETWRESLYLRLERGRVDDVITAHLPQFVDHLTERFDQSAFHAGRSSIYVRQVLFVQQILQQRSRVAQALDHAVHETLKQLDALKIHVQQSSWREIIYIS